MSAPLPSQLLPVHPGQWCSAATLPGADRAGTRAGVLAAVLGLHVLALSLFLAERTPAAPEVTPPMIVALMAPPQPEPQPRPEPQIPRPVPVKAVTKTTPPRPQPRPAPPQPAAETSITTAVQEPAAESTPAPAAPVAAAPAATAPPAPPTLPRFDAAYLNNQTPYPPLARRLRETGTVQLRVLVSAEGQAERIELLASSGSPRLDEGAQAAVRRWRFIPARQGEQNIASTVVVPIIFKLEES